MQWLKRWEIRIHWDRPENSPFGGTPVVRHAYSMRELRTMVQAARADRHVVAYPYRMIRQLAGERVRVCRLGHGFDDGVARPAMGWVRCRCGGHLAYGCRQAGCRDVRLDPLPGDDCERISRGRYASRS
jgi:hypothetical protein